MSKVLLTFSLVMVFILPVNSQRKIFGGVKINNGKEYNFQVSVWQNKPSEIYFCTGAVISKRFVLTCAHCFVRHVGYSENIFIKIGVSNLRKPGFLYGIKRIIMHEQFIDRTKTNDISLLLTDREIDYSAYVQPIPIFQDEIPVGSVVIISGWGLTETEDNRPDDLYFVNRTVIDLTDCKNSHSGSTFRSLTEKQFCTSTNTSKGTCKGDSGGPIVYKRKLVGIVSGGVPCATGIPDVHTKILSYIPWILSKCLLNT